MAHTEDSLIACDMPVYPTLKVTFMFTDVYGQNGKSQNGDKPNYECECVCVKSLHSGCSAHSVQFQFYCKIGMTECSQWTEYKKNKQIYKQRTAEHNRLHQTVELWMIEALTSSTSQSKVLSTDRAQVENMNRCPGCDSIAYSSADIYSLMHGASTDCICYVGHKQFYKTVCTLSMSSTVSHMHVHFHSFQSLQ